MTTRSNKQATPDFPIHEAIAKRWSPYAYDPNRAVESVKLRSCLEAARWAASSYNEQPWSIFIARREDLRAFETMLGCLLEANQAWAKNAGVLMLTVVQRNFKLNGKPNRVCEHDIGLAMGNLVLQATALDLDVHQMAGVDLEKVRKTYKIPTGYDPYTAVAIGYAADIDAIEDPQMRERENAARTRKLQREFVFSGSWGQAASL